MNRARGVLFGGTGVLKYHLSEDSQDQQAGVTWLAA